MLMARYTIINNSNEKAIINSETGEQISQWWSDIKNDGLINEQSEYYIVRNNDNKWAIFHIHNPCEPISQWWDEIYEEGLVKGESEYYAVRNHNKKFALFHKDDLEEPVTNWHTYIYPLGLLNNTSNCYAVLQDGHSPTQIYHLYEKTQYIYEIHNTNKELLLYFDSKLAIYIDKRSLITYDSLNTKENVITILSGETKEIMYDIDIMATNQMIAKYIDHHFLPILVNKQHQTYCYLYTLNGDYIGKFLDIENTRSYIQQHISNKYNNLSYDIMRIY